MLLLSPSGTQMDNKKMQKKLQNHHQMVLYYMTVLHSKFSKTIRQILCIEQDKIGYLMEIAIK